MKKLNLAWFVQFGEALRPVVESYQTEGRGSFASDEGVARRLKGFLDALLNQETMPLELRASRPKARELIIEINGFLENNPNNIRLGEYGSLWHSAYRMQMLLHGELADQPVYNIWPKRAYSTDKLIDNGSYIFSEKVRAELTEGERTDIEQAGKCLAVEVPTAAAFHIFRATESIIRRYYELVVGHAPKPKMRNWGVYIKNLEKCNADRKVLFPLMQIKDLYRNPVIHPEDQIDIESALSLLGIAESAISAIVDDMLIRRMDYETPQLPFSPSGSLGELFQGIATD